MTYVYVLAALAFGFQIATAIVLFRNIPPYYLKFVARHDHKAFQDAKLQHFKVRVGQQKQKKAK